jgi:putative solute:sodium symporter small subunit
MTEPDDKSYDINFFKPRGGIALDNTRVIILFLVIWAVAVFGFQFLLKGTTKPTAEASLVTFNELWPTVESATATIDQQQTFSKALLMVLGKNIVLKAEDKEVLKQAFSLTVHNMAPAMELNAENVANILKLENAGFDQLMIELLPYSIVPVESTTYSSELPSIVSKYCTHPRGPLTDATFLGFPFHYWYSAQFLLLLFVVLCLLYAIRIEKIYIKHNFVEEND